jgi:hypothetical protein
LISGENRHIFKVFVGLGVTETSMSVIILTTHVQQ